MAQTVLLASPVPGVFICHVCGDSFSSQKYLDGHVRRVHAQGPPGQLECPFCPYRSNIRYCITQHARTHTGAKPYSCQTCSKRFGSKQDLTRHEKVHTKEKPYTCTVCGQQFTVQSSLARHRKLHSKDAKPYACLHCRRTFMQRCDLVRHVVTHRGEKLHACRVCGQAFTRSGNAREHETRVHALQDTEVGSVSVAGRDEEMSVTDKLVGNLAGQN